jgi:hypothetical protein
MSPAEFSPAPIFEMAARAAERVLRQLPHLAEKYVSLDIMEGGASVRKVTDWDAESPEERRRWEVENCGH